MKIIDAAPEGITQISWSPNGEWIAYVRGEDEVCIANISTDEIRVIGKGACPGITSDNTVILERNNEILAIGTTGEKLLFGINDLVKNSPKRAPVLSFDGTKIAFVANNVFDKDSQTKNAYPYRHFIALGDVKSKKATMTREQWYGGTMLWFPDGSHFVHFEYDSTGGAQLHILTAKGEHEGTVFGLYPSVSPDGRKIACKPKSGGNVVIYTCKDKWHKDTLEAVVMKIPQNSGHLSATPPLWIDNRHVLVDETEKVWRVDTRRDNPTQINKFSAPTSRGESTWSISPTRELLAMEVKGKDQFELQITKLN